MNRATVTVRQSICISSHIGPSLNHFLSGWVRIWLSYCVCNIICEETKDGTESSLMSVHSLEEGRRMRKLGVVKWNVDDHFSVRI